MKVPFLRESVIESHALNLLYEYGRKFGEVTEPPIPLDGIVESHLELSIDYDNLPELLQIPDVLGATFIKDKKILIDLSLDSTEYPSKTGRCNFTIAHEVGHWVLHRHLYQDESEGLFGSLEDYEEEKIVCRTSSYKEPMEWQADRFAATMLMPVEMVKQAWKDQFDSLEPYVAEEEIADLSIRLGLEEGGCPTVSVSREFAPLFSVSAQAMQIRLIRLGLIETKSQGPGLFNR